MWPQNLGVRGILGMPLGSGIAKLCLIVIKILNSGIRFNSMMITFHWLLVAKRSHSNGKSHYETFNYAANYLFT